MIHHVSIPARDPKHVAEVLAEVMGGRCVPFGPLEGAFMALGVGSCSIRKQIFT